jgi:hypothetical protein
LDQATREMEKRAHNRAGERLDELNVLAAARLQVEVRAQVRTLGPADGPEQRRRAEEVLASAQPRATQLEEHLKQERDRLERFHARQELPSLDLSQPSGRPPAHAPALGLRAQQGALSEAEVAAQIRRLEVEARAALERLGPLDTPGKAEMAARIRATLAQQIRALRERAAGPVENSDAGGQLEDQIRRMRQRAEVAIQGLGELDTPEKARYAATLRDRTEEQVRQLIERAQNRPHKEAYPGLEDEVAALRRRAQSALDALGNLDTPEKQESARRIEFQLEEHLTAARQRWDERHRRALELQVEQEAQALRRRAQLALNALGDLDTSDKQELARRIRAHLEQQERALRSQLARRAHAAAQQAPEEEVAELRRRSREALAQLGRLDTPESIRQAREIRARLDRDINLLPTQQVERSALAPALGDRGREAEALAQAQAAREREAALQGEAQQQARIQEAEQEEVRRREVVEQEARRRETEQQQVRPTPVPTREPTRTPAPSREPEPTREPSRDTTGTGDSSGTGSGDRGLAGRP